MNLFSDWYIVNSRKPWLPLKKVSAAVYSRKVAWIEIPNKDGTFRKQFVGQTVFKDRGIALRDQASRCRRLVKALNANMPIKNIKFVLYQCRIRVALCNEYLRKE